MREAIRRLRAAGHHPVTLAEALNIAATTITAVHAHQSGQLRDRDWLGVHVEQVTVVAPSDHIPMRAWLENRVTIDEIIQRIECSTKTTLARGMRTGPPPGPGGVPLMTPMQSRAAQEAQSQPLLC